MRRIKCEEVEVGGVLGGLFADSAYMNDLTYANGLNWLEADLVSVPGSASGPRSGDVFAIRTDVAGSLKELWRFRTDGSPNLSGVAIANGVIYFHSSVSGILYALDRASGTPLRSVDVGSGVSGPAVSNGRVCLRVGDSLGLVAPDHRTGAIVALAPAPLVGS